MFVSFQNSLAAKTSSFPENLVDKVYTKSLKSSEACNHLVSSFLFNFFLKTVLFTYLINKIKILFKKSVCFYKN